MSVFYVGQRVRIVGARTHHEHVGKEGTVVSPAYEDGGWGRAVMIDGFPSPFSFNGSWHVLEAHMEPIVPRDLESIEDINALYEPQITEADIPSEVWQR